MANNHNTKVSTSKQASKKAKGKGKKIVAAAAAHENGSMEIYNV